LASDNEDTPVVAATPPETQEKPAERSEKKMERNDKPAEKSEKSADKLEKPQETKLQDGAKSQEAKPAVADPPGDAAQPAERTEGGPPQQGHRRKQGQGPQKNGSPTLDLVELKDMSIQKLNQVAKDLSVTGAAGLRKQELIFKILQTYTGADALDENESAPTMPCTDERPSIGNEKIVWLCATTLSSAENRAPE
jgi:hypothetical protein